MTVSAARDASLFAHDCIVVGAGMAGLACARRLAESGLRVLVLEAKRQVGGRVMTEHRNGWPPLELGAEFVHGAPADLVDLLQEAQLTRVERGGAHVDFHDGELHAESETDQGDMFEPMESLRDLPAAEDQSFQRFISTCYPAMPPKGRQALFGYVEGFNAADASTVSARSLGVQQAAEDTDGGDAASHIREGYIRLPEFLAGAVRGAGGQVRFDVEVRAVRWAKGRVALETSAGEFTAPCAVLTLPLGVLHARAVAIHPEPVAVYAAAAQMRMGVVCRFSLLFRHAFWYELPPQPAMNELSFLFSPGEVPNVWWTVHPEPAAILTGWVGGPRSVPLLLLSEEQLARRAVRHLAKIFQLPEERIRAELLACRSHNWSADPYARGAYSYAAVGGSDASAAMSRPVEHTLFFAGEHTDTSGNWGTVHGAMRSGVRAADQVLAAVR